MPEPAMTNAQRSHIFRLASERGLDIDAIRAMTPDHSIRQLSRVQASVVIEALKTGKSPDFSRRPPMRRPRKAEGVIRLASEAQLELIEVLRVDIGWTREEFQPWLGKRHFDDGRPMTDIRTGDDAERVIELLKHVRSKSATGRQRSAAGHDKT